MVRLDPQPTADASSARPRARPGGPHARCGNDPTARRWTQRVRLARYDCPARPALCRPRGFPGRAGHGDTTTFAGSGGRLARAPLAAIAADGLDRPPRVGPRSSSLERAGPGVDAGPGLVVRGPACVAASSSTDGAGRREGKHPPKRPGGARPILEPGLMQSEAATRVPAPGTAASSVRGERELARACKLVRPAPLSDPAGATRPAAAPPAAPPQPGASPRSGCPGRRPA